jgi:DnaJ-domain-containing protein 1
LCYTDQMNYNLYEDPDNQPPTPPACDHEGCGEAGLYPAPKSRHNLNERYHFCLDHVREYNKKWNYFAGYSEEQMYSQMREDLVGNRPTWPSSISVKLEARLHEFVKKFTKDGGKVASDKAKTALTKEAQALQTMGLAPQSDNKTIKMRYRELVKKYHPDKNPDNPKAVERFKIISEAYMILRSTWQTKE